jgi:Zn-dependent protease
VFGNFSQSIVMLTTWIMPLLLAITLHEAAHGYAALMFGDDTAKRAHRLTLNPVNHIDPFGTLLLPGLLMLTGAPFLFGYAKPVPVNFRALKNPKRDMIWVAAAGPGTNVLLAVISALLIHAIVLAPSSAQEWIFLNLQNSIAINLVLAVFNMIPLPPLDGGRVAVGILPDGPARKLASVERYGILILLGVLFLLPMVTGALGAPISIFQSLILPIVDSLYHLVLMVTGLGA